MTTTIRCDIVSAEEEIFSGDVIMVVASGEMGELGIAPRHAPLITRLKPGKVVLTLADGERKYIVVSGGILEVQPQVVSILADTAVRAEDLDEAKVQAAKAEAERIIANRGEGQSLEDAQRALLEATVQMAALENLRKSLKH
jgi:F-type H+-transporting ATPase subunit epsilon